MFDNGRVRSVSPAWFRSHVLPAFEESWEECESYLLSSPLETIRVQELRGELSRVFERPIVVERGAWYHRKLRVRDGVHRAVAAMSLGIDIHIRYGYPVDVEDSFSDVYFIEPARYDDAELLDKVISLSSFRCSAGPWIQSDIVAGHDNGPFEVMFPRHTGLRGLIAEEFQHRLQRAGVDAVVSFLETVEVGDVYDDERT